MSFQIYDPFVELGISPDASIPEAKKAAYNLLKCHHPDKSGVDSDKVSDNFITISIYNFWC